MPGCAEVLDGEARRLLIEVAGRLSLKLLATSLAAEGDGVTLPVDGSTTGSLGVDPHSAYRIEGTCLRDTGLWDGCRFTGAAMAMPVAVVMVWAHCQLLVLSSRRTVRRTITEIRPSAGPPTSD